ncbi:MAG: hypothetical protein ACLQG3_11500 [Terracidiphilus sp.]
MAKWRPISAGRVELGLATAAVLLCGALAASAQVDLRFPPLPSDLNKEPKLLDRYPDKPSLAPVLTIPAGPLGFSAPGDFYLLRRHSLVSLDFLDENRLLFTFHGSGLVRRDAQDDADGKERQIRAVVVLLPDGKIESQAAWIVPDPARYLWMLKDGHFLLRDLDGLEQGDATLKLTPYLRLPGRLLWVEMDPAQQVIVANSLESEAAPQKPGETGSPVAGQDATAPNGQKPEAQQTLVVRTLRRESGESIRTTRVPWTSQTADWPIDSGGYVESVKGSGTQWLLSFNSFAGGKRLLAAVDSTCLPHSAFVTEAELLVSTCEPGGGGKLVAMSSGGARLWEVKTSTNTIWPLLAMAPDSSRVARETLVLKRPVDRYKHLLSAQDLRGQMVRVFDVSDGKVKLEAPLSPMFDAGGNVAISPSGRRVAILSAGAIQVFELAAPVRSPDTGRDHAEH